MYLGKKDSETILETMASGELLQIPRTPRNLPLAITNPGIISDSDNYGSKNGHSDVPSPVCCERKIIVANLLPLHAHKDIKTRKWCFSLNEDSILLQLKDGFSSKTEVIYVGSLKVDIDASEQEEVAQTLLEDFNCVPTFLPTDLQKKFYQGFCKQQLWPLFHYRLPMFSDRDGRFDRLLWQAYVSANKIFADKVKEVINPKYDYVWVHDYHLMVLPTFLRKHFNLVKLGFFLHSPFPTSEIYRTLPVRDEILRAMLNCDLIGFHIFDYARHFLSCCSRMLGLDYETKRGYIGLVYLGRTVYIKILPVGLHLGRLESELNHDYTSTVVREIQDRFKGKKLILGVDDMDIFKGINLKLLAVEQLLQQQPQELQGKLVLVQIMNPARSTGKDVEEAIRETYLTTRRINETYGYQGYEPVILIDRFVPMYEKVAYYAVAECCIVNALRDGMNLVPYEYIVCRQGTLQMDETMGIAEGFPHTSVLVVSEFIGCSPSLSGAIRVNPWNVDAVAEALHSAINMNNFEKQLQHEKHYQFVSSHDVAYWARSFVQDLERACKDHYTKCYWGSGFGLDFRVMALSPSFRKLSIDQTVSEYKRSNRRAIFLDYDGTIMPRASIAKTPTTEVIAVLNDLCSDPKNTVFIVSGRGRISLSECFAPCEMLGIAAEHGYFIRWSRTSDWESSPLAANINWKMVTEPVMRFFAEATDGSYIETKESALVWHHQNAEADFGSFQAVELLDYLEQVLANEPVNVKRGKHIVEVKPQQTSKGLVVEKVLSTMANSGKAQDFVMCIGDGRSDEDMFEKISGIASGPTLPPTSGIFACTVGRKPSKAKYYLDDIVDVVKLLQRLATASIIKPKYSAQAQLSPENGV
ncbi:hypothetical protein HHK36_015149 [Tetracentron sinense]|uniref:alpha,alpha-trehalose-phosphate synthase (UDP-forming) n=1 Tax=Tetracentron sinense TaxID=13715 RepID=A0A834Z1G6_TETSI|nr:hypothetical protein HHK36_015149 [Tetracentron sinense]